MSVKDLQDLVGTDPLYKKTTDQLRRFNQERRHQN